MEQTHHLAHTNMEYENTMVLSSKMKKKIDIFDYGMEWPLPLCGYVFGVVDWCNVGDRRRTFGRSWSIEEEMAVDIISAKMVEQFQHCLLSNVRCPNLVKNLQHQFQLLLLEPKVFMEYDSSIKSMEMFKFE